MTSLKTLAAALLALSALAAGVAHADETLIDPPYTVGAAQVVVISTPGQYRLAHRFSLSGTAVGISITSPGVTLDLDGNIISGGWTCTRNVSFGNACTTTATTTGVINVALTSDGTVRIRNGVIEGAPARGISVTSSASYGRVELEDLLVKEARNDGIYVGLNAISLRHASVYQSGGNGVNFTGTDAALTDVHANWNNLDGIYAANNVKVQDSSASNNGVYGIDLPSRGTVDGVLASDNGNSGFFGAAYVINGQARNNHGAGFDQVKLVLDSEAVGNTLSGYVVGTTGCYSRLRASGNATPQIGATAVALAGSTATCP